MTRDLSEPAPRRVGRSVDGECTMYVWQAILLLAWIGPPSVEGVRRIHDTMHALRATHPQFSVVHLLHGRTGLPSAAIRAEFERLGKSHEQAIACTGILDDRKGFTAGAVKAVITGLVLVAGLRLDIRIFEDLEGLIAWLLPRHADRSGLYVDAAEFRAFLRTARDAHP